ncbi:uncharacterized protein EHS24_003807 [Apiotrichum porosum]|uniref:Uncharacterized protein n=1 Tax=Apiotrichum porosum TaxID=105984 RepID=A0A427XE21_9TREE|nr:uncharacterized protein EHS24_003807 [Apiotrichum porosum]RSH77170.1 hypothetical protein EHS24_003807 [Apiotrichum porosum]
MPKAKTKNTATVNTKATAKPTPTASKPARRKPYTKPSKTTPADHVIDACYLPHVMDSIIHYAPVAALLVIRSASKGCKAYIDALLKDKGLHLTLVPGATKSDAPVTTNRRFGHPDDDGLPSSAFLLNFVRIFDFPPGTSYTDRQCVMDNLTLAAKRNRRAVRLPQYETGNLKFAAAPTLITSFDAFPHPDFVPKPRLTMYTTSGKIHGRVTKQVFHIAVSDSVPMPTVSTAMTYYLFDTPKNVKELVFMFSSSSTPLGSMSSLALVGDSVEGRDYLVGLLLGCCGIDMLNFVVRTVTFVDCGHIATAKAGETWNDRNARLTNVLKSAIAEDKKHPRVMMSDKNGQPIDLYPVVKFMSCEEYRRQVGDEQFAIETTII